MWVWKRPSLNFLLTLRKASFCSRCLLINGRRWSLSVEVPSLSWLPHQSSSRRYSCSRLSNTLQTWTHQKTSFCHLNHLDKLPNLYFRKHFVPAPTFCRRLRRRWQASGGPPSSASAVASGRPLSRHSLGSPLDRSDRPGASSGTKKGKKSYSVQVDKNMI